MDKAKTFWSKLTGLADEDNLDEEITVPQTQIHASVEDNDGETSAEEEGFPAEWIEQGEDGQLAVDVFQDEDNIYIKSTIAGVDPDDLDIYIDNDMITIRGKREHEETVEEENYFYRECYWGNFSRSIILPTDVQTEKIDATIKNGVLTITLPKAIKSRNIEVKAVEK